MRSRVATLYILELLTSTLSAQTLSDEKRGFSVPARRVKSLARRDDASSVATEHVVIDFTFGGQRIPVSVDTGSSFTYVASTLNITGNGASLPAYYNPNTSTTYHDQNIVLTSSNFFCATNSARCVLGTDDVATAGLTAQQMVFGVASDVEDGVFDSGQAGTIGFGRQAHDPSTWYPRDQTFWYLAGANLPSPYLFTVDVYQDRDGSFDFGFIDQNKYRGDITWASMDTSMTQWNFNLTGFAIGGNATQDADEFTGVIDTGGPNIGLPAQVVTAYFASFGGTPSPGNSHTYPCSAYPPPDLTLRLASGGTLVLNSTFLVEPPDGSGSETCSGRLDDSVQTQYNIGASVIDQKFVIFDNVGRRVGFADKASFPASGSQPAPSSSSSSSSPTTTRTSSTTTSSRSTPTTTTSAPPASTTTPNHGVSHIREQSGLLSSCMALIVALII